MKRKFLLAAFAATALAACSEKISEDEALLSDEKVSVEINVAGAVTKADQTASETNLYNLQVFVFGENGKLEAYKKVTEMLTFTIDIMKGKKTIHVLGNAQPLTGIHEYADLRAQVTNFKENTINRFVMEGWKEVELTAASMSVTVDLNRIAAKISLVKIENKLTGMYEGMSMNLRGAYLVNVAGNRQFISKGVAAAAPTVWYNKRAYSADDGVADLTYRKYENIQLQHTGKRTTRENFYCYPNACTKDSSSPTWSERCTRLVVEVELDKTVYYYPVTLPVVNQNTNYEVSLTITRPGSTDADVVCDTGSANSLVKVITWADGESLDKTI